MGSPYRKPLLGPTQRWKIKFFLSKNPWVWILAVAVVLSLLTYTYGDLLKLPSVTLVDLSTTAGVKTSDISAKTEVKQEAPKIVEKIVEKTNAWHLSATKALIVGGYGDNFDWEATRREEKNAQLNAYLNPVDDYGKLILTFDGKLNLDEDSHPEGHYEVRFTDFFGEEYRDGGITEHADLFGNTRHGDPYLPPIPADIAAWGHADMYLDGQLLYKDLNALFWYGPGVYRTDGKVRKDEELYSEKHAGDPGFTEDDTEAHILITSSVVDEKNYPRTDVALHLLFEDVNVEKP